MVYSTRNHKVSPFVIGLLVCTVPLMLTLLPRAASSIGRAADS